MNHPVILSSHYLPCVGYLQLCASSNFISIEQHEIYTKGSYRNRAHIASAAGVLRLSIPLEKGKNQKQPVKDVCISYTDSWQRIHWQSLCTCYNHSPFFEFYKDELGKLYSKKINFLIDWNIRLLQWLFSALKLNTAVAFTETYNQNYNAPVVDARNAFSPKTIIPKPVIYQQVFETENGFLPNLSCIDMLFNIGREDLLKKMKHPKSPEGG